MKIEINFAQNPDYLNCKEKLDNLYEKKAKLSKNKK